VIINVPKPKSPLLDALAALAEGGEGREVARRPRYTGPVTRPAAPAKGCVCPGRSALHAVREK
jgi:hypothetical protein